MLLWHWVISEKIQRQILSSKGGGGGGGGEEILKKVYAQFSPLLISIVGIFQWKKIF